MKPSGRVVACRAELKPRTASRVRTTRTPRLPENGNRAVREPKLAIKYPASVRSVTFTLPGSRSIVGAPAVVPAKVEYRHPGSKVAQVRGTPPPFESSPQPPSSQGTWQLFTAVFTRAWLVTGMEAPAALMLTDRK